MPRRHALNSRRRRLAMQLQASESVDAALLPSIDPPAVPQLLVRGPRLPESLSGEIPPAVRPRRQSEPAFPVTVPQLVRWMRVRKSLTWVFTGDSLTVAGARIARGGSFEGIVTRIVRDHLQRQEDVFVNTSRPNQNLKDVFQDLDQRVFRFTPDIVVVTCGLADLQETGGSYRELEALLRQLTSHLRKRNCVLILGTPPAQRISRGAEGAEQLIRLEALRNVALESSAFLVDHWGHWEERATTEWYRSDGKMPSEKGAIELARFFIDELQLMPPKRRENPAPAR